MKKEDIDFIPPKNDRMFKAVFTKNKNCLKEFVSSLTEIPLDEMENLIISNSELHITDKNSKMPRLDLLVKIKDKIINIEIQLCKTKDFIDRSLYYWARLYSENSEASKDYNTMPQTICVNILNYKMFRKDDKYKHSAYIAVDGIESMITDKFKMIFFELPKISDKLEPENDVKLWLQFLKAKSRKELEMVKVSGNTAVAEAAEAVIDNNAEWQKRMQKIQHDIAVMDERAALYHAREEGKEEALKEITAKLKKSGLSQEEIDKLLS